MAPDSNDSYDSRDSNGSHDSRDFSLQWLQWLLTPMTLTTPVTPMTLMAPMTPLTPATPMTLMRRAGPSAFTILNSSYTRCRLGQYIHNPMLFDHSFIYDPVFIIWVEIHVWRVFVSDFCPLLRDATSQHKYLSTIGAHNHCIVARIIHEVLVVSTMGAFSPLQLVICI